MTDKEIIQALKDNEKPFGLMTDEMRSWYIDICCKDNCRADFETYTTFGEWTPYSNVNKPNKGTILRLCPDYEAPEPEVATLKGMQGCAWEDAGSDTIAAINELQDACDIIIDTVQAMIESKK